jgi:hypothetical protein
MTNHERALKTYQELQRRKAKKAKFLDGEAKAFLRDTFYKCLRERRDLKIYR